MSESKEPFEEKPVYTVSYDSIDPQISIYGVEETVVTQPTHAAELQFDMPGKVNNCVDIDRSISTVGAKASSIVESVVKMNIDQTMMRESVLCDSLEAEIMTSANNESSELDTVERNHTFPVRYQKFSTVSNQLEISNDGDQISGSKNFLGHDNLKYADTLCTESDTRIKCLQSTRNVGDSSISCDIAPTSSVTNESLDKMSDVSSGGGVLNPVTSPPMSPTSGKHRLPQMLVQKRPGSYQVSPTSQGSKVERREDDAEKDQGIGLQPLNIQEAAADLQPLKIQEARECQGMQPLKICKHDGQSVVIVRQISSGSVVGDGVMGTARSRSLSGPLFNVVTSGDDIVRGNRSYGDTSTTVASLLRCQSTPSTAVPPVSTTSTPVRTQTILKVTKNVGSNSRSLNSATAKVVTATTTSAAPSVGLLKVMSVLDTSASGGDAGSKSVQARAMPGMIVSTASLSSAAQLSCDPTGLSFRANNTRSISFGTVATEAKFISQLGPGNKIQLSVLKPSGVTQQQQSASSLDMQTSQSLMKIRNDVLQATAGTQEPSRQSGRSCTVTVIKSNNSSSVLTTSAYHGIKSHGTVWKSIRPSSSGPSSDCAQVISDGDVKGVNDASVTNNNADIIKPSNAAAVAEEATSSSSSSTGNVSERKFKRKAMVSMTDDTEEVRGAKSPCFSADSGLLVITYPGKTESRRIGNKKKTFSWEQYMIEENVTVAPPELFRNAFPATKMGFRAGMKLEGIDPRHPYLYCVLSVREVKGYRMMLHFDQYSESYDFWVNGDCPFIFPPGWAERNGKPLQPPRSMVGQIFDWTSYMKTCGSINCMATPKNLFPHISSQERSLSAVVRVGMKLEAVDKKSTSLTCVATVADILGDKILVHFDGWESVYDYWADMSSPYIHPVGWCQDNAKPISPPNDWEDISSFTWEDYLEITNSLPVPNAAFKPRGRNKFKLGQRLEAVDKRNPLFVRVASVVGVEDYKVKLHFDGWSDVYDFWEDDDSADIHPAGWCYKTGHVLTPPLCQTDLLSYPAQGSCPTPGCTGVGHIKGAMYAGHHSAFGCPYSAVNLQKEFVLPDRLSNLRLSESSQHSLSVSVKTSRGPTPTSLSPCDTISKKTKSSTASVSNISTFNSFLHLSPSAAVSPALSTASANGKESLLNGGGANVDEEKMKEESVERHKAILKLNLHELNTDSKPLVGPGSGRGRKKKKILRLIQKKKELEASVAEAQSNLLRGIHQSIFMISATSLKSSDEEVVRLTSRDSVAGRRELPRSFNYLERLLPEVVRYSRAGGRMDVYEWSVEEVATFISHLTGCASYASIIYEQQVDGEALLLLTQADIVDILKIKLGPAVKIYNSIIMLKDCTSASSSTTTTTTL